MILLDTTFVENLTVELVIASIGIVGTIVGSYILIRERITKTEAKLEAVYVYVDQKNQIIEEKVKDIREDMMEFKDMMKETQKSLNENTSAIRELKFVLEILKSNLGK